MSLDVTSTKTKRTGCHSEKLFLHQRKIIPSSTLNEEFNLQFQKKINLLIADCWKSTDMDFVFKELSILQVAPNPFSCTRLYPWGQHTTHNVIQVDSYVRAEWLNPSGKRRGKALVGIMKQLELNRNKRTGKLFPRPRISDSHRLPSCCFPFPSFRVQQHSTWPSDNHQRSSVQIQIALQ